MIHLSSRSYNFFFFKFSSNELTTKIVGDFLQLGSHSWLFSDTYATLNNGSMHTEMKNNIHKSFTVKSPTYFSIFPRSYEINRWKCSRVYCSRVFECLISRSALASFSLQLLHYDKHLFIIIIFSFLMPVESHLFVRSFVRWYCVRESLNLIQYGLLLCSSFYRFSQI